MGNEEHTTTHQNVVWYISVCSTSATLMWFSNTHIWNRTISGHHTTWGAKQKLPSEVSHCWITQFVMKDRALIHMRIAYKETRILPFLLIFVQRSKVEVEDPKMLGLYLRNLNSTLWSKGSHLLVKHLQHHNWTLVPTGVCCFPEVHSRLVNGVTPSGCKVQLW